MARRLVVALAAGWFAVAFQGAGHTHAAALVRRQSPPTSSTELASAIAVQGQRYALQSLSSVQDAPSATSALQQALVRRYCVGCHNDRTKAGGLSLSSVDLANVGAHGETLEKVVRKLRVGMMPPLGAPRPPKAEYDGFRAWLEGALDRAAADRPALGPAGRVHRLNRAEYQNAVRDLLAVDVDATVLLPADDSSYGFDNIADVLRMSPTLMEAYLAAARKIARLAGGAPPPAPNLDLFRIPEDVPQDEHIDGLPFGTRGGKLIRYNFPGDGEYVVRVRLARMMAPNDMDLPTYVRPQVLEVSLDGERVKVFTLAPEKGPGVPTVGRRLGPRRVAAQGVVPESPQDDPSATQDDPSATQDDPSAKPDPTKTSEENAPLYGTKKPAADAKWDVRFPVKAGVHDLVVTFLNREPIPELLVEPYLRPFPAGGNMWSPRRGAYVRTIEISGPFSRVGAGDTPSRQKIFACYLGKPSEEAGCARTISRDSRGARFDGRSPTRMSNG